MKHSRNIQKTVAGIMTIIFGFLCLFTVPVQAALVGTDEILQVCGDDPARRHIVQKLQSWGVDPEEARERVNAMTDREVKRAGDAIDRMPAGAGAVEVVAILAFLGFITLLVTDILGYTDIFPFVKKL